LLKSVILDTDSNNDSSPNANQQQSLVYSTEKPAAAGFFVFAAAKTTINLD
jgi:hypothetical protein